MKKLWIYILLLFSLVEIWSLSGCSAHPHYDGRLTAADSLTKQNVDSALTLLEAINPGSLGNEADRAYHALLLTEAQYKCYIPATGDSAINRALDYYKRHGQEREKLTRAYIFKGAVMEELGENREAMQYYKQALSQAAPDDYFNQGYIRLRMGNIYRDHLVADSADIMMFKEALNYFKQVPDSFYVLTCLAEIGSSYGKNNLDSVLHYLYLADTLAETIHADQLRAINRIFIAKHLMFSHEANDIDKAKNIALTILRDHQDQDDAEDLLMIAAFTLAKQNKPDSAMLYLNQIDGEFKTPNDMVFYHNCLAEVARARGDIPAYQFHYERAYVLADSLEQNDVQKQLRDVETQYDNEALKYENLRYRKRLTISLLVAALALSLMTILLMAYRRKLSRRKQQLKEMEDVIDRLHDEQAQLSRQFENDKVMNDKLKEAIQRQIEMFTALVEKHQKQFTTDPKGFAKLFESVYSVTRPDSTFWTSLHAYADSLTDNLVSRTVQAYPELLDTDVQVLSLCCSNLPTTVIMACMGYNDAHSVYNKKRRIAETMGLDEKLDDYILHLGH
jgi:tetratricopeptide (TPR) repeat protein